MVSVDQPTNAFPSAHEESRKIDCRECPWYADCPRMKGVNVCHGSAAWEALYAQAGADYAHPVRKEKTE